MNPTATELERWLAERLPGATVRVEDDSARHAGHAGMRAHGGGHYAAHIVWDGFTGHGRVARHRMVHDAISELMAAGRIHALQLHLSAPGENA